jgi:long-chain acyl-CoA synthetase
VLLHQYIESAAARAPGSIALIEPRRSATYEQLDRLANRFARLLQGSGLRRGDRVIIALDNGVELVAAYFGTMKAGGVAVPLPGGPRSDRLAAAVRDCAPAAAIVDAGTVQGDATDHGLKTIPTVFVAETPGPAATARPDTWLTLASALDSFSDEPVSSRSIDQDLAAIIYTSGSTGDPRGVMLTHRNFVANARSIVQYLSLTPADRVMCVLPFYYVYGLSLLHTHLAVGASLVVDNRFTFPNVVLKTMQDQAVTGFAGVPSTFSLLLHRTALESFPLPSLRYVTQAGGGMAPPLILDWLERGWQVPFYVMYGATEASARLTYLEPSLLRQKVGSIGRAIPNVEITVRRPDGSIAAIGETGELVARGANISPGYWNNPEETRQRFGEHGYRTGDLGYADADGCLFLAGRLHDLIKVGAHRVGAKEIEDVIYAHPSVLEAAVVAGPHEMLGEAPLAFVVLRPQAEATSAELRGFCASRLAPHKVPTHFVFRPDLPKIPGIGKIDRQRLRQAAELECRGPA